MIAPILAVKNVDTSVDFYTKKLGFKQDVVMQGADGTVNFAFVGMGPTINIGLTLDPALDHRGNGVDLMLYPPDDLNLDQFYAQLQAQDVKITEPIADQYWGDRAFTIHDPDGYSITFAKTIKVMSADEIQANSLNRN